jgi:membrane-associated phospholipid phosphatase
MRKFKELLLELNASDLIVICFALFLSILNAIFCSKIPKWALDISINLIYICFIFSLAYLHKTTKSKFWEQFHYWYLVPTILFSFKEVGYMIKYIHMGKDYDQFLIAIDRFLFGTDPTHLLFNIANPVLTEVLQIAYSSFYFLPVILGIDLILNKRIQGLTYSTFIIVYGFYLSYLGYFLWPGIGPRFTLHVFENTSQELPGIFATDFIRDFLNSAEGITKGALNPAALVQRDVFPSGHTQMTLLSMYLAYKFKAKSSRFIIPAGILLIFGTVYLRYHYVVDLLGGTLFMVLTLITGHYIYNKWAAYKKEPPFNWNNFK